MKERVEQLAKGNYIYEMPGLLVSKETISFCVEVGQVYKSTFTISNHKHICMKGVLYASTPFIQFEESLFAGFVNHISYTYNAINGEAGKKARETITIVSDCGEVNIPVEIEIEHLYCESSVGKIKDIYQLANLAKINWQEAVQIFLSEKFEQIVSKDMVSALSYRSLRKSSSSSQALDEFLIAMHKKNPVVLAIDKIDVIYEAGNYDFLDTFYISKDGWGYASAIVKSSSPFCQLSKTAVCSEDFVNRQCVVEYTIQVSKMTEGKHFIKIEVETQHQTLILHIQVHVRTQPRKKRVINEDAIAGLETQTAKYDKVLEQVNKQPYVLKEFSTFEQMLTLYALRHKEMSKDAMTHIIYLASRKNNPTKRLRIILTMLYHRTKSKEALQGLCSILIAQNLTDSRFHYYYNEAIRLQLKVEKLPEYYIYSRNKSFDTVLSPYIVSYFNFHNELSSEWKAYYYACLIVHKDSSLQKLHSEIRQFVDECIRNEEINVILAILYQYIYSLDAISEHIAYHLSKLVFTNLIECNEPNIVAVAVGHKESNDEVIIPIKNNQAYVQLYTQDAMVFFIDHNGFRYQTTVSYHSRQLLDFHEQLLFLYENNLQDFKIWMNLTEQAQFYQRYDKLTVEIRRKIAEIQGLLPSVQAKYKADLIFYYYESLEFDLLDQYLALIDMEPLSPKERAQIIEILMVRRLYDLAYNAVLKYGYGNMDIKRRAQLCVYLIQEMKPNHKERVWIAQLAYGTIEKGKPNQDLLEFICNYYNGPTLNMYAAWTCAKKYQLKTKKLEERLLAQILFSQAYISNAVDVFFSYCESRPEAKLFQAYLSNSCYRYLLFDCVTEKRIFSMVESVVMDHKVPVQVLALLKYYNQEEKWEVKDSKITKELITWAVGQRLVLSFFRNFSINIQEIEDKVYIEYRSNPNNRVYVHYLIEDGFREPVFQTEEMKMIVCGYFCKEVVLFRGEVLQYYITEMSETGSKVTESRIIEQTYDIQREEQNNYDRINQMIEARELKDEETLNHLLKAYLSLENQISELFSPCFEEDGK